MSIGREQRLRWFSGGVTIILILVCNVLLFVGLWVSGLNLDVVLSDAHFYDPTKGLCVRVEWTKVMGIPQPVKVCSEWLEVSDPTGRVYTLREGVPLTYGEDGKLHYQGEMGVRYRLFGLVIFSVVVLFSGMWVKRFLISWYQWRLSHSRDGLA